MRLVAALAGLLAGVAAAAAAEGVRGLPFTRSYPFEEIGNVPRGARLSFDAFGRVAVIHDGVYSVLNDTVWVDMGDREAERGGVSMANVALADDGSAYYGGLGSWGTAQLAANGRLCPSPKNPADAPDWTLNTSFTELVATADGAYFAGWNGIVFWDRARQENRFFECAGVAKIFRVGDRVFVSAHGRALHTIDVRSGVLREVPEAAFGGVAVECTTPLDETHVLLSLRDGRLVVFDGRTASPWPAQARHQLTGFVSNLHRLVDGGVAVAITGKGLFLISEEGEMLSSMTTPQHHRITAIATREPGVLWVAGEDAVEKVLYAGSLTSFGQRLGLPVSWPIVLRWRDRIVVSSSGQLYEAVAGPPGAPSRFALMAGQPAGGAWAVAARGAQMLVGNVTGVFATEGENGFVRVADIGEVAHLAMVESGHCYAIGRKEIAVLRWANNRWSECAPRIPGLGHPAVVHAAKRSAWVELGGNKVARISLSGDRLKLQMFDDLPWKDAQWVNVGIVGDLVVLGGTAGERIFYDEKTEARCEAPELQRLLGRSPYWITRIQKDDAGTLWAAHHQGVVTFTPVDGGYEMDASTFDLINDQYPVVHLLPGNDVWFSTGRSLHHVERRRGPEARTPLQPMLVSVVDGRTNVELRERPATSAAPLQLPFAQNSLSFRFFSGGYSWRRAPVYEFRLNGGDRWATLGSGSLLSFPGLREGRYRLEVRIAESSQRSTGSPVAFAFEILPPWHRTWPAYASYGLGLVLALAGVIRWTGHRTRRRNLALERLVEERTNQLKSAMEKLNEETRNLATLAERQRLAGEIHDSLQQGLSGLMLQLDATLKLPTLPGDVRSRLNVARNMVSFTRHEVQNAVWDMESPLLDDGELGGALRKLTTLISPGAVAMDIAVSGAPAALPPTIKHHLLRIAQEAITNAVRHASATRVSVRLDYRPDAVSLAIADDGAGFSPDEVMSKSIGHFGLRGLRSRASKIGGELRIESSPGQGTQVRVVVPTSLFSDASQRSA
ncbi:MAG TPA: ATP-binding protein [Opitutaceae bacterium]